MKNTWKTAVLYFLIGVGLGGLSYSATLVLNGAENQTVAQIVNVVWISGLIGLISMIFELERPNFAWQLFLHFLGVCGLVALLNYLNNLTSDIFDLSFLGKYAATYLIIWIVVYFVFYNRVHHINRKLQERQSEDLKR
ncbi:DUF3021 domain-containing protein [Streptococcus chenjunshii]|uniref:DUF3021 domain-containing protein n=1 Tax=Streptococcus chenjunshii TaxID=2173853 RepID=A0A372KJR7_9STRE|nr:DUF3021 domain-containing protein [Streptococcus chenjunshii]AXQ79389.1 DUF3021 domain-containing protein [Streptococcus chenjunshii]RFU50084.1 DUF3021 domain-containing protein [Streptococcus chenjunshii]RFU52246.1 DUF3021 domain-containing protein [Streptococcus chenjunshii]